MLCGFIWNNSNTLQRKWGCGIKTFWGPNILICKHPWIRLYFLPTLWHHRQSFHQPVKTLYGSFWVPKKEFLKRPGGEILWCHRQSRHLSTKLLSASSDSKTKYYCYFCSAYQFFGVVNKVVVGQLRPVPVTGVDLHLEQTLLRPSEVGNPQELFDLNQVAQTLKVDVDAADHDLGVWWLPERVFILDGGREGEVQWVRFLDMIALWTMAEYTNPACQSTGMD